jgi:predicted 3-demethylubiquinone-9 3-methyltransferase (glyoxalase superfamily)
VLPHAQGHTVPDRDVLVAAGATPTQCAWIKDPFGLSWQIVLPKRFLELIADPDPAKCRPSSAP